MVQKVIIMSWWEFGLSSASKTQACPWEWMGWDSTHLYFP